MVRTVRNSRTCRTAGGQQRQQQGVPPSVHVTERSFVGIRDDNPSVQCIIQRPSPGLCRIT